MKERPILFSAPMVRALLAGTKTQTRRVVKPLLSGREWVEQRESGSFWRCADGEPTCYTGVWETHEYAQQFPILCPYGQPGDRLWVREAWAKIQPLGLPWPQTMIVYREGDNRTDYGGPWKPGIHMFRRDSRITLEVTGVRVERLQDISEADAVAEGIPYSPDVDPVHEYRELWESINGEDSWSINPWVWVVSFHRMEGKNGRS